MYLHYKSVFSKKSLFEESDRLHLKAIRSRKKKLEDEGKYKEASEVVFKMNKHLFDNLQETLNKIEREKEAQVNRRNGFLKILLDKIGK